MKNMKVAVKLLLSFIIVIIMTAAVGVIGIFGMTQITAGSYEIYEDQLHPISTMGSAQEYFQRIRVQMRNVALNSGNQDAINNFEAELTDRQQNFLLHFASFRTHLHSPEALSAANEIESLYNSTFLPGINQLVQAARNDATIEEIMTILGGTTAAGDQIAANIESILDVRMGQASALAEDNANLSSTLLVVIIVVLALAIVVALIFAIYISRIIGNPLKMLSTWMKHAALTGEITMTDEERKNFETMGKTKDEIGETIKYTGDFVFEIVAVAEELRVIAGGDLSQSANMVSDKDTIGRELNNMLANLNTMFREINNASGQVSAGSKQIADGAQSLAQGSTEQAASVQQLSASIHEIADKTKENAKMAGRAANLASTIKTSAEKGSGQMDEMMTAVKDINESSQNISKVIKSIDDIAFQTNILALNAAVEAARAGQHGKGFAVVAEEVRNLAAKSAEAAKDTESLIADSITKAELGSRIADETAESLREIVSGIDESTRLVGDIARSSEEQSVGISQVNQGVDQVSQVVQQNSATAEESAAASQEMSGQALVMEELISRFKLKSDSGSSLGAFTPPAPLPPATPAPDNSPASFDDDFGKY
jgi:methyl-accepting chemotaxis protein